MGHGVQPLLGDDSQIVFNTVYTLHGHVLEVVTSAKYLGLMSLVAYPGTPT